MRRPIVWTIAGSDSGGGAGIQADLLAIHALGGHPCTVITALTAQNSVGVARIECVSDDIIRATIEALWTDLPPVAIKLGMLGSVAVMRIVAEFLGGIARDIPVVVDPVMIATNGANLMPASSNPTFDVDAPEQTPLSFFMSAILPLATLVTPNLPECATLCRVPLDSIANVDATAIERCAQVILSFGAGAVLVKGGHATGHYSSDYFLNASGTATWLSLPRLATTDSHGTGCTLSAAIATCLASGAAGSNPNVGTGVASNISLVDAVVISKAYVWEGLRRAVRLGKGPGPVAHTQWPRDPASIPFASAHPPVAPAEESPEGRAAAGHVTAGQWGDVPVAAFLTCGADPLGFYPIVGTAEMVERMAKCGVTTVQIRVKKSEKRNDAAVAQEVHLAIEVSKRYPHLRLFVNDHWRIAVECGAYGVHVGQEDLEVTDVDAIRAAGLRLGVSTHSYIEFARTKALRPSYVSLGPVYPTSSKEVPFAAQGPETVAHWRELIPSGTPLVAIGGISLNNVRCVLDAGAEGVAVISAISQSVDPEATALEWMRLCAEKTTTLK